MEEETVERYVTREVMRVAPSCPMAEALHTLAAGRFSCLVVCEKDQPIGIITERDVAQVAAKLAAGEPPLQKTAADLMTSPMKTIRESEPAQAAAELLLAEAIRHLVVVDEEGCLLGLLSQTDLLRAQLKSTLNELSGGITSEIPVLDSSSESAKEKRTARRYLLDVPIRYSDLGEMGEGRIRDISIEGMNVTRATLTVEPGAIIRTEFSLFAGSTSIRPSAEVTRKSPLGFAAKFVDVDHRTAALLRVALPKAAKIHGTK